ncbi:hypothetical protein QC762_0088720 [Podospora pseudocomata]|uniref:Uncharacterized protein n=1 Tax=Podospora pseudocomata TaxID=2093779 RepID=A0ABR0GE66_9PEZI|nr:hypothetical protein QC762_0088720 [Podospora pseudocomata]
MVSAKYLLLAPTSCLTFIANGSVWWHTCGNYKCPHTGSYEGFSGTSPCIRLDSSIRSIGLTRVGTKSTTCSIFSDNKLPRPEAERGLQWDVLLHGVQPELGEHEVLLQCLSARAWGWKVN